MGKPAARQGDQTAHGGVITVGCPTVLIGGMPAARLGDMHTCPMQTPAPAPVPHVGGPIILGSSGVMIANMPAARMGDQCTCVGPPDVIVGGCATVLIGEAGGGGGGGGGGGMGGGGGSQTASSGGSDSTQSESSDDDDEDHYIDVSFVDGGGRPVVGPAYSLTDPDGTQSSGVLGGRINQPTQSSGSCDIQLKAIIKAAWEKPSARDGEAVKMLVETAGIDDGAPVVIVVYERDVRVPAREIARYEDLTISGDKAEQEWSFVWEDAEDDDDAPQSDSQTCFDPKYYFEVQVDGCDAKSDLLDYKDFIEVELKDEDGEALPDARYRVFLSNGEVRQGTLDGNGYAKVENVPPGPWSVEFPDHGYAAEE